MKKLFIVFALLLSSFTSYADSEERAERRSERAERMEDRRDERHERAERRRGGGFGNFLGNVIGGIATGLNNHRPHRPHRPHIGPKRVTRHCKAVFSGRSRRRKVFHARAQGIAGNGIKRKACRKAMRKCRNNYPRRAHRCRVGY